MDRRKQGLPAARPSSHTGLEARNFSPIIEEATRSQTKGDIIGLTL